MKRIIYELAILISISIIVVLFLYYIEVLGFSVFSFFDYALLITIALWFRISYYLHKWNRIKNSYENHSVYALQLFMITYKMTESLSYSIKTLAEDNIPFISTDFMIILGKIMRGDDPKQLLMEYSDNQPSLTLREGLKMLISLPIDELTLGLIHSISQKTLHLREKMMKIEGKLSILMGLFVFIPIIIILSALLYGLSLTTFLLLLILQISIMEVLSGGVPNLG